MITNWYAVRTIAGHENKVKDLLITRAKDSGLMNFDLYDVVIPEQAELATRRGKKVTVNRKVFPSYIFINAYISDPLYKMIRSTSGVTGFIESGGKPVPMQKEEVERVFKLIDDSKEKPISNWERNMNVRVVDGPFNDFAGTILELDDERQKMRVSINVFNRDTPVELDYNQVERI